MSNKDYQKKVLMELMNIEEFLIEGNKPNLNNNLNNQKTLKKEKFSLNPYEAENLNQMLDIMNSFLVNQSFENQNQNVNLVEGNIKSKTLFIFGECEKNDNKIMDGEEGILFDKMLGSVKLDREKIALISFIPRGFELLKDNEEFIQFIQLLNYRIIELLNPRNLIILGNYSIKMLLASNISSMSLRGKWFDFNTPNDTVPKKTRVLYEPKMLINNPELKKDAWEDLKAIKLQLGG